MLPKHQKWPKMEQNSIIGSFYAQRAKKPGPKPFAGARRRPYLLVSLKSVCLTALATPCSSFP